MSEPNDRPATVVADDIRAGYGGGDVLKGVSLAFHPGEVLALLGPNGAGKSTLIRVLTGALALRAGRVSFPGRSARAAVGLAPQEIALYPWLSPAENCLAFARLSGLSRAQSRERLGPAMRLTGCEPVAGVPISRLSGGYQRRANVAAALMTQPDLLILDEPTAGLDAEGRQHVGAVIAGLRETGAAILLVTHEFDFAESLADRVAILTGGALACCGALPALVEARLGRRDRVEFVLKTAPNLGAQGRLGGLGARTTAEPRMWRLWREAPGFDTRRIRAELDAAGLEVVEMRVRPPGLEDLFVAATGGGLVA